MPLTPGDRLGPYEIVSLLGKGGMGEVHRARDPRLGRDVAIKVSAERFEERFAREARTIASLNHPNICQLYDVGPNYLVMELVEGPTLAERIQQGPIPLDEATGIARQIADALGDAHAHAIVHRDLKPGNVKIKPDGMVKVLDFGLAKVGIPAERSENSPTLTMDETKAGVILGTAAYMAPEQAKGKVVDKRADIWAFGVVLYEMLTRERLHQGDTLAEVLASVLKEQPDLSRVPVQVRGLLRLCLQKEPKQRLHDIADAKLLLQEIGTQPLSQEVPVATSVRPWLWPAIAATGLLAAAALAFVHFSETKPVAQPVRLQIPVPEGLTFIPGTDANVSPDGRSLAFAATDADGITRMYVRPIDSLEAKPLAGTEVVGLSAPPSWSFDSRSIVFAGGGKLKKAEISGTPAQDICNNVATTGATYQGAAWNHDDVIIFAGVASFLQRVPASGGTATPLTVFAPGDTGHRWPQFLPDGHHFLYHRASSSPGITGIYVGSLDAKPEEQDTRLLLPTNRQAYYVPAQNGGSGWLVFLREETLQARPFDPEKLEFRGDPISLATSVGSYVAANAGLFSVSQTGVLVYRTGASSLFRLTWRDAQGKTTGTPGELGGFASIALSGDATRVAFTQTDSAGNRDIFVLDLGKGTTKQLTFDSHVDDFPVWSPDGTKIAFASNRTGRMDLYEQNADGSGANRELYHSDQDKTPTSWSRDDFLLFDSQDPKMQQDILVLPLTGNRKVREFPRTESRENNGAFSSDGRWIAYVSRASGRPEVLIRPFSPHPSEGAAPNSGDIYAVSKDGGMQPRWTADSKELFFINTNGQVMAVNIEIEKSVQVGPAKRLINAQYDDIRYGVTGDGKRFLLAMQPPSFTPFTVVVDWRDGLKK